MARYSGSDSKSVKKLIVLLGLVAGALYMFSKSSNPIVSIMSGGQSLIRKIAQAIAEWESGGDSGALNFRYNNPGNLSWDRPLSTVPWAGAVGIGDQDIVIFDSIDSGWAALYHQLNLIFSGKSDAYSPDWNFYQIFNRWAAKNGDNYARFVAGRVGADPNMSWADLWSRVAA